MSKEEEITPRQSLTIKVYKFNRVIRDFEELILDPDVKLKDLLVDDSILLFVDPQLFRAWFWYGSNITTRMKFLFAKNAPAIRNQLGIAFKTIFVDQDNESQGFFSMLESAEESISREKNI